MKSKSTTEMDQRVNKSGLRTLEPLEAKSGQVLLLSTERKNVMKTLATIQRVTALNNEIGRILQMAPKTRKEMGFDAHLEILVQELNALVN